MSLPRVVKPEYLYRPQQLIGRLRASGATSLRDTTVELPWGHRLTVDPTEAIGSAVVRLGVYDLVVTEALWRLTDRGEHALDVGANIGCMTSVLAFRCGLEGVVAAFEPHPDVCRRLRQNVAGWPESDRIEVRQIAVGDHPGSAQLVEPVGFSGNAGGATLAGQRVGAPIDVQVERLDDVLAETAVTAVAKIDVEGFELAVLRGGSRIFSGVRDVVVEAHEGYPSAVTDELERQELTIFRLERSLRRPLLIDPGRSPRSSWEAPNFLATRDVVRAEARFAPSGWHCLSSRLGR